MMKSREYHTDILSHGTEQGQTTSRTRQNNTFKSSILYSADRDFPSSPRQVSREKFHPKRALVASVTRTSFQDSNLFGNKETQSLTIQPDQLKPQKSTRTRDNSTFQSNVFSPLKAERPKSRARVESHWKSNIFDGPLEGVPERQRKNKIKQKDAGVEGLFGKEDIDFQKKNQVLLGIRTASRKWTPVLQVKTADQRKNEELYGQSAALCQAKKGDNQLMMSAADWRNPQ